jgi:hypothetical protein
MRKHVHDEDDPSSTCNSIETLSLRFSGDDWRTPGPFKWLLDVLEHFTHLRHLTIGAFSCTDNDDWSNIRLPHLQHLFLEFLEMQYSSFRHLLYHSKRTIKFMDISQVSFLGGTFAELFLELDATELIWFGAHECYMPDRTWTERDRRHGKLFCNRMNVRRSANGESDLLFFSRHDDSGTSGSLDVRCHDEWVSHHYFQEDCFAGWPVRS